MNTIKLISILSLLIILSSCKKDDEAEPSKTELISDKKWKYVSLSVDPPYIVEGVSITDLFAFMPSCTKDDYLLLNKNDNGVFDEGPSKCDQSDPQSINFTWSLENDQSFIQLSSGGKDIYYQIVALTDNRLRVTYPEKNEDTGVTHMITAEYAPY